MSGLCTGLCFPQGRCITALKIRRFVKPISQHLLDILRRCLHCRIDLSISHMIKLISYPWRRLEMARDTCFVGPSGNIFMLYLGKGWADCSQIIWTFVGNAIAPETRAIPEITPRVRTCTPFLYLRYKWSPRLNLQHYVVCLKGC